MTSTESLSNELKKFGIRPSYHRIKVLECLDRKDVHPTVDEIFHILSAEIPSLSKATIYNTLHTFVEAGLARVVNIDEGELRYDIVTSTHGHFRCDSCGTIYNFSIDIDRLQTDELDQFQIKEKNIYFKGICPNCIHQIHEKE